MPSAESAVGVISPTDFGHKSRRKKYPDSCEVSARRIEDNEKVQLKLQKLELFSFGAFSNVYKGIIEESNAEMDIAVKKTWGEVTTSSDVADDLNTMEINILKTLRRLKHKNMVQLMYCYSKTHGVGKESKICYSLVFEFLPMNLYMYLKQHDRRIDTLEAKLFAWQLMRGQAHLQHVGICHRDIKPQNLLVNPNSGMLKISDFGSSTTDHEKKKQPSYHVTRYYRPPELLLESRHYSCAVDVWSSACVYAEMIRGAVFFAGKTTNDQLQIIIDVLGLPSTEEIGHMKASEKKLEKWKSEQKERVGKFAAKKKPRVASGMNMAASQSTPDAIALLEKMLVYTPSKRLWGTELLMDPHWDELFEPGMMRPDGQLISFCLTEADRNAVKNGDQPLKSRGSRETLGSKEQCSKERLSKERLSKEGSREQLEPSKEKADGSKKAKDRVRAGLRENKSRESLTKCGSKEQPEGSKEQRSREKPEGSKEQRSKEQVSREATKNKEMQKSKEGSKEDKGRKRKPRDSIC